MEKEINIVTESKFNDLETNVNEHSSMFTYSKNLGINSTGSVIQMRFLTGAGKLPDKGTALLIGSHNVDPFAALLYYRKSGYKVVNIVGSLTLKSVTELADLSLQVRLDTSMWGTCSIYSTVPITDAKFTN